MEIKKIKEAVCKSLGALLEKDSYLLDVDVNERSITHRLAIHLGEYFKGYDIDCEYNRDIVTIKTIPYDTGLERDAQDAQKRDKNVFFNKPEADIEAHTVYPDIIVHKRGDNDDNLLVIEVKKSTNRNTAIDEEKLRAFTSNSRLAYSYGVSIIISVKGDGQQDGQKFKLKWFENGAEDDSE